MKTEIRERVPTPGQSLVETALFLPIILLLLAGVLELSSLLVTQNRVSTAARIGTGFGATNYNADGNVSDTFQAMSVVARNNVTETLDLQPDRWDIYTVKATLNYTGDGFTEWIWERPYGNEEVFPESDWIASETQIQSDILDALGASGDGLEIVATVAFHHRESFLGLGFFNIDPLTRIRGLTVMRISETTGNYGACDTFPIAVSLKNYSVWPSDQPSPLPTGHERYPFEPGVNYGGNQYYWPNWATEPPPTYTVSSNMYFPAHQPGEELGKGTPVGTLFLVKQASAENSNIAGAFGWLRWDENSNAQSAGTIETSLGWPGDSGTYNHPWWSDDGAINVYDQVLISTGSIVATKDEMREHVDKGLEGRELRIIVFTPPDYEGGDVNDDGWGTGVGGAPGVLGGGTNFEYEVYAFIRIRMVAWDLSGQDDWMLIEFRGWDVACTPE